MAYSCVFLPTVVIRGNLGCQQFPSANITTHSVGGIATYSPNEANRNAAVRLYLPE